MIERLDREIRRRTRAAVGFPDGDGVLMFVCARIRYVTVNEWSTRRYLDVSRLDDSLVEAKLIIAPWTGHDPKCATFRTLGAADVFLEIITQPFLGFDGIVLGSSNQATV